jgi:hypothetical protein
MPKATVLPQTPEDLLERLSAIFPEYRAARRPLHGEAPTFHSVLIEFSTFFGGPACSLSEHQLRSFGELVSAAMEAGGHLENAFATCLLEHTDQIGFWKVLRPFLSRAAIEKSKA